MKYSGIVELGTKQEAKSMFYTYAVGIDSRHRKDEIVYHYEKRQHYILIYTRTTAQFQIDDEEIPVKREHFF